MKGVHTKSDYRNYSSRGEKKNNKKTNNEQHQIPRQLKIYKTTSNYLVYVQLKFQKEKRKNGAKNNVKKIMTKCFLKLIKDISP